MRHAFSALLAMSAGVVALPAHAVTRGFPVGGFDRIANSTPFDVRVHTGAAPAVHAEGAQQALDRLDIAVRNGELVIATQRGGWFSGWSGHGQRLLVDVTVPGLRGARLSGPGSLTIDHVRAPRFDANLSGPGDLTVNTLETEQLDARLSGPGDMTLSGRAITANLVLSGPGDMHMANLVSRDATVALSGPGDITATVTGQARGSLSGPGDIAIHGGARCAITKSGPGDVLCR